MWNSRHHNHIREGTQVSTACLLWTFRKMTSLPFFLSPFLSSPFFASSLLCLQGNVRLESFPLSFLVYFAKQSSDIVQLLWVGEWMKCVFMCALTPWIHPPCAALHPCHCPWSWVFSFDSCFSGHHKTSHH